VSERNPLKSLEVALAAPLGSVSSDFTHAPRVIEVFVHAKVGIEAERLREISNARSRLTRRCLQDLNFSTTLLQYAADNPEGCGLTGAIRPDQPEDFPRTHLKADGVQSCDGAAALAQFVGIDDEMGSHYGPPT